MRDLIRMAADGIHYLAVFDDHSERPIYLGRQQRIATADQRIICYARDGGCTRPDCFEPGYHSEVHHSPDWDRSGRHRRRHPVLRLRARPQTGQRRPLETTVTDSGRLAWTNGSKPPEINHAHHPEELLRGDTDPPEAMTRSTTSGLAVPHQRQGQPHGCQNGLP